MANSNSSTNKQQQQVPGHAVHPAGDDYTGFALAWTALALKAHVSAPLLARVLEKLKFEPESDPLDLAGVRRYDLITVLDELREGNWRVPHHEWLQVVNLVNLLVRQLPPSLSILPPPPPAASSSSQPSSSWAPRPSSRPSSSSEAPWAAAAASSEPPKKKSKRGKKSSSSTARGQAWRQRREGADA